MEHAVLDDLAVQLGNAVDGMAGVGADVGHADLVVANDCHVVDLALIAGEGFLQVSTAAAVHFLHDLPDTRQGGAEDIHVPLFQSLAHDSVVGVSKDLAADVESCIPFIAALIQQNAHHFGDGNGRVGIVQLDGDLIRQVFQGTVLVQVVAQDIGNGSSAEEVLLAQAKDLALGVVIVGVQDLGDQLCGSRLADSGVIVAGVEAAHIKAGCLGLPQAQLGNALRAVTGNVHIVGNSNDRVVVFVLDMVETALPGLDSLAVKADLLCLVGVGFDPHLAAGQPVVSGFLLPAVHDLLLEDAVLIQNRIAGAGDAVGSHAIQVAGSQTAQAAVAEACIRLLLINGVDLDIGVSQNLLGNFVQAQVEQAGAQAAAHQELHAEVIDLFFAFAQGLGLELLLAVRHDLTNDHCHAAVDLLGGSNVQRDAAFADDLVFENFFKFFFSKFHQKYPSPYGLSIPEPSGIILATPHNSRLAA